MFTGTLSHVLSGGSLHSNVKI